MTDIMDIPPGASQSDTLWRRGFFDGQHSHILTSTHPIYVSGWCHGWNDGSNVPRETIVEMANIYAPITDYIDLQILALRLAGFEIRDTMMWMYGSGFPKSANVSKMIDKQKGLKQKVLGVKTYGEGATYGRQGQGGRSSGIMGKNTVREAPLLTKAASPEAQHWEGWASALKPAFEPIILIRKPLEKGLNIAQNVLKWGTGALNIDASRVAHVTVADGNLALNPHLRATINGGNGGNLFPTETQRRVVIPHQSGRWPANVLHDGSDEVEHVFLGFGTSKDGVATNRNRKKGTDSKNTIYGTRNVDQGDKGFGGGGSVSRFFYCAKVSTKERGGSKHPTQKPLALIEYCAKLITPPKGVILDPFFGSGTTGVAGHRLGFPVLGIERDPTEFQGCLKKLRFHLSTTTQWRTL